MGWDHHHMGGYLSRLARHPRSGRQLSEKIRYYLSFPGSSWLEGDVKFP